VVAHLGLDDWVRVSIDDELDCIGPVAQGILRRHGVLWPANTHFHVPQLERATGGAVLTGIGGDEMFSSSRWTGLRQLSAGRQRPQLSHLRQLAALLAPAPIRQRAYARRRQLEIEWLRHDAERRVLAAVAKQAAAEPFRWRTRLEWLLGLRYLQLAQQSMDILAGDWNTRIYHPLLAPGFVSSLASLPRDRRYSSRSEALTDLFGDLLPKGLATRTSKAVFTGTLWGQASRAFATQWDGQGVDTDLVDVDALRRRWSGGEEGPYSLLQSLWLAGEQARQDARATASS
jgi:Asparagine synthase